MNNHQTIGTLVGNCHNSLLLQLKQSFQNMFLGRDKCWIENMFQGCFAPKRRKNIPTWLPCQWTNQNDFQISTKMCISNTQIALSISFLLNYLTVCYLRNNLNLTKGSDTLFTCNSSHPFIFYMYQLNESSFCEVRGRVQV